MYRALLFKMSVIPITLCRQAAKSPMFSVLKDKSESPLFNVALNHYVIIKLFDANIL